MIRRFGFLDTAQTRALGSCVGEERHSCRFVGFLPFYRHPLCLCRVARRSRSGTTTTASRRSAVRRSRRTSRRSSRQSRCAVVRRRHHGAGSWLRSRPATPPTAKPLTLGTPDRLSGDVPVTWDSNHFVKGQTDTYIPFTLQLDQGDAAIRCRDLGPHRQCRAGGGVRVDGDVSPLAQGNNNNTNQPPARATFAWDNGSFVTFPRVASCSARSSSGPGSTWPTSRSRRRALRPPATHAATIAIATTERASGRRRTRKGRRAAT